MTRNYAQFATSIWRPGDDFGELTDNAQRVYFMLATQADISAAGVLSLNVRRWTGRSADGTRDKVVAGLQELAAHRFIAYDYDTEEVLIRTFIKWDGGYSNNKRRQVIQRAAGQLESAALRKVLAEELAKLGLPVEWVGEFTSDAYRERSQDAPNGPNQDSDNTAFVQVDSPCHAVSRFEGVVVTEAVVVDPQPTNHNPQPVPPPADPAGAASAQTELPGMPIIEPEPVTETDDQRAWRLARAWLDECPSRKIPVAQHSRGDPAMKLKNLLVGYLTAKSTEDEINETLRRCDAAIPAGNFFADVLKRVRRERDGDPGTSVMPFNPPHAGAHTAHADRSSSQSTGAQRARQAMDVAAQLRAEAQNGAHP